MAIVFEKGTLKGNFPVFWRGECKVLPGVGQPHGPADVARKDDGVLGLDELAPVAFQPLHIAVPAGENVHRLGGT